MTLTDALPNRPLTPTEVAAIATADGVMAAVPTVRREHEPTVVSMLVRTRSETITLGWHPDRSEWGVVKRHPTG